MVTLVKHEWHQVDVQYAIEIDEDILREIYPEMDEDEIAELLVQVETGYMSVEELVNEASANDIELDWEHQYDDMWTMRKGGYDVTHELGDENSWVDNTPESDTHKCTKCKWTGQQYEGTWVHSEDDNESSEVKQVCPMCESELELTEHGVTEDNAKKKRIAEIEAMFSEGE
jgi:hypothetical protein